MDVSRDSVWQLCDRLRAEKLLVFSEVDSLRGLHTDVEEKLINLGLLAWKNANHQVILSRLLASHPTVRPENAAHIASDLDAAQCLEAYRRLGHHHSTVERLLILLNESPLTVAEILHAVDHTKTLVSENAIRAVFTLVYGNAAFPSDEKALLQTLSHLVRIQLVTAVNPRLIIRKGTAVFPRLYRMFSESVFASKIFLTSALHDSVMLVLCQDEMFLDIDPEKSPLRFPAAERARRFGEDRMSSQYHKKVAAHRKLIVERLVLLAHNFIKAICDSLPCFPNSLIWLVKEVHSALVESKGMTNNEATLICSDMIVTNLLCPVIANPETVGVVSDTPISHIARFNLMQIGQIVQTLALSRHEPPPPHFQIFANQFRDSPICSLVDTLLSRSGLTLDAMFPVQATDSQDTRNLFRRHHSIGSIDEVNTLVHVLHSGVLSSVSTGSINEEMSRLCRRLPAAFRTEERGTTVVASSPQNRPSRLKNFADKVQTSLHPSSSGQSPSRSPIQPRTQSTAAGSLPVEFFDVVVFQMGLQSEKVGLVPEDSFMEALSKDSSKKNHHGDGREKRARFVDTNSTVGSAISDHTADNASDLEEEAAEQDEVGSVSSSQEAPQEDRMMLMDEDNASTLPDNVSDVGGISGRGTPSLSGRDTPLSQANRDAEGPEQDADLAEASTAGGAVAVAVAQRNLPPVPVAIRKQNAEGLEEKFGKFTVPTSDQNRPYRDDQRSLLSDSWSTNVVASDDEGSAAPALPQLAPPEAEPNRLGGGGRPVNRTGSLGGGAEDRSDTWSLDAIASDSEADGGRERERRVRDVQDEVQEQDNANARAAQAEHVAADAEVAALEQPLIDLGPGDRVRRQSSGSTASHPRSEATSEGNRNSVDSHSHRLPAIPKRQPVYHRNNSIPSDVAGSSGGAGRPSSSSGSSGIAARGPPPPLPADVPGPSNGQSNSEPSRRKMDLFKGLQRVGDKVRKGMSNTPLRQLPHSSTLSDLLGELNIGENQKDRRPQGQGRMAESRSENRIADMDRSADDILAKYQRQAAAPSPAVLIDLSADVAPPNEVAPPPPTEPAVEPYYSAENLTRCRAFLDAKRKLRLVLGSVGSLPSVPIGDGEGLSRLEDEREQLLLLLRTLLAEAINGRQQVLSAHIREVMRCLQVFDSKGIRKLLRTLREEHRRRTSYVLYLQHSRLVLLRMLSYVDKLSGRIEREKTLVEECLVDVLIRFYLEKKDAFVHRFLQEFAVLKAQDEKTECLSRTLSLLFADLPESSMWKEASSSMQDYARKTLERVIMGRIHAIAFYPNQEADRLRDDVLHKALVNLSRTMTPDHPMMRIRKVLHGEAPWPSAQAEINIINAYKSARDKLACIVRCCETISNLVSMAPGVGAAAADDVTPVLVYVLIQANPPALLSNVQYIQSFGGALLDGAEGYWWTQFTAAIEFIKTLL